MDDLPAQPADGATLDLYHRLRWLYILGFLEALLGVAIVVTEITAICLFYDRDLSFYLEPAGIVLGIAVFVAGVVTFYAGRRNVVPSTRRRLFYLGAIFSLICIGCLIAMFVLCVLWTHYRYEDVRDKSQRLNSQYFRDLPYVFSLEGSSHMAHLRALAAAIYLLTLIMFLVSGAVHVLNINKNKSNIHTNGNYTPVKTEKSVIYNNNNAPKTPISSKLDLPWIDQN